jgi:Asp-tRNAAsn/Glu-tRNAGln amidotransferase B subunit (PET112 homolog)
MSSAISVDKVSDFRFGENVRFDAWLYSMLMDNNIAYGMNPDIVASQEQMSFMVSLARNQVYLPCSDDTFKLLCRPTPPKELRNQYNRSWRIIMKPEALAELVRLVDGGTISAKIANDIFGDLFEQGVMPEAYVKEKGLAQISDTSALEAAVDAVIAANPAEVEAYRGGKTKLISFFVGQIMPGTRGRCTDWWKN